MGKDPRIEIKEGMSGTFCIMTAVYDDIGAGPYRDVVSSGHGRYRGTNARKHAELEGLDWAEAEELPTHGFVLYPQRNDNDQKKLPSKTSS